MSSSTPIDAEARPNEQPVRRGKLKVFLGYAAGVGKTYRMLDEAQQLKREGKDIVLGYFEPHGRKDTIAKTASLEIIPRRTLAYRSSTFEEMDTPAILARHPGICVVDELAHTNIPGAERLKRWEDVQALLDSGIDVLTTMNIQHLESLNDQVFQISGIRVRETVPDWFVKSADEVVMVDATTGALLNRLKRGNIYAAEKAQKAMENFFKESTLAALRELALRQTAHELELREEIAQGAAPSDDQPESTRIAAPAGRATPDRILICVTEDASTAMLIRRARRMADYLDADCFAVYVSPRQDLSTLPQPQREAIEKHLSFARNLHIETRVIEGKDVAQTILDFARRNQVTQILLARRPTAWWKDLLEANLILRVVSEATDMRVIIVAARRRVQQ